MFPAPAAWNLLQTDLQPEDLIPIESFKWEVDLSLSVLFYALFVCWTLLPWSWPRLPQKRRLKRDLTGEIKV